MRSYKFNLESLPNISLKHLFKYLNSFDWHENNSPALKEIVVMRKTINDQEEEIVVPRNQEYADFKQRIYDALTILSRLENIDLNDIISDLSSADSDILRIRISGNSVENGNIPFLDEMAIKEGFKKMLSAVACQVIEPKPFYKKLHKSEAELLLRNCMTGQSEKGSYIIKFYFPSFDSVELPEMPKKNDKPFARRVAEHLMISLKDLVGRVETPADTNAINAPFNANFCYGLVEMKPIESKIDIDFQISWSDEIPCDKSIPRKAKIFDSYLPLISKVGERMKPQQEITQTDFIGKITALQGSENETGLMEGDVILALLVDDESKKAKTYLTPEFYSHACDAHKKNKYIRVSGQLQEKPRLSILQEVSTFEIVSSL